MKSSSLTAEGPHKSKKSSRRNQVSINHLLDFQSYEDLEEYHLNYSRNQPRRRRHSHHNNTPKSILLRGFAYVNCHYKFVVDNRANLTLQMMDPNVPVKVEDILCILAPKGNNCPICLSDEPIAPRMLTACGHILCLTCLYSLLESEVPKAKKRQAESVLEKYRECPLCSSFIKLHEVVPVQITTADERFEVPKVGDDGVLSLMIRPQDRAWAIPKTFESYLDIFPTFPEISDASGPQNNSFTPEFLSYLRILEGGFHYIDQVLNKQKDEILHQYELEKELYQDDGVSTKLALKDIEDSIALWTEKFSSSGKKPTTPKNSLSDSILNPPFHYYQTGFNASATFVLSPLDMKVLKTSYGSYGALPSTIVVKIENIRYEELTAELAQTKYKYLSHLPFGSSIGFIDCNWYKNEYIDQQTWTLFASDLSARTKVAKNKSRREENNRRRALNDEELKVRRFYEMENGVSHLGLELENLAVEDLPSLSQEGESSRRTLEAESVDMTTSVWGTQVPKTEPVFEDDEYGNDWDAEDVIRKAKQESLMGGGGKGKKKKRIVLSLG